MTPRLATALALSAALAAAVPALAQQQRGGGHPDMQTVVLESLVAERGEACGVMASWEAAVVRSQARKLYARFDADQRPALRQEARERAAAMACDDPILLGYAMNYRPLWETEELPRYIAAYRALALMDEPPNTFQAATGRLDYARAIRAIDTKLAALEVDGVEAPGHMTWAEYADRNVEPLQGRARQLEDPDASFTRTTADDAAAFVVEAAVITEGWLAASHDGAGE